MATYITQTFNTWTEIDAWLTLKAGSGTVTVLGYTNINGSIVITIALS